MPEDEPTTGEVHRRHHVSADGFGQLVGGANTVDDDPSVGNIRGEKRNGAQA